MLPDPHPRAMVSGKRVAVLLAAIVVATAVVPPLAAFRLNRYRIERAEADVQRMAGYLRQRHSRVIGIASSDDMVICSTGRLPKASLAAQGWLTRPTTVGDLLGADRPQDPWGRCYVVNLGRGRVGAPVLVLSAGPNGLIDTSLRAAGPEGDDIGVRVW